MLGIGLAMDAFSVSVANGLRESGMTAARKCVIAGTYAGFQIIMPIAGWLIVSTAESVLMQLHGYIPLIALILLSVIGIKMIIESIKADGDEIRNTPVGFAELMLQGVATSIDALSVGFAFALYDAFYVIPAAATIGAVTFVICLTGLTIGKAVGMRFTRYSGIAGGIILLIVGMSIFIRS
ncbi:MAG: manganese efflux pump MntP family protein [Lachnospiraceae bacterium]|nr:manganese efflux pump MntP family protein [Lachnospiraceae bacterium]